MDGIDGKYLTRDELKKLAMVMMEAEIGESEGIFIVNEDDIEFGMMDRKEGWKLDKEIEDRENDDVEDK